MCRRHLQQEQVLVRNVGVLVVVVKCLATVRNVLCIVYTGIQFKYMCVNYGWVEPYEYEYYTVGEYFR